MEFVGRERELAVLGRVLDEVRSSGAGAMVALRGRRQVGKSTLAERFCTAAGTPYVFFAASRFRDPDVELREFVETAAAALDAPQLDAEFRTWGAALSAVASTATATSPVIVVLDEFPWLIEADPAIEGVVQTAWDRTLRRSPVLVLLIGSDLAMMDALGEYGRPLYDRLRIMRLDPLAPSAVANLTGLDPADAIDLYLAVGGFPNLVHLASRHGDLHTLLRAELADPTSPLVVAGERSLSAEFPENVAARPVLEAVGAGSRQHGVIASRSGIGGTTLNRALDTLVAKQAVARLRPYSTDRSSRRTRYEVRDPYLRFWLAWLGSALPELERGRGEVVADRILSNWPAYRGTAVEPVVREAITRMLPDEERFGPAVHVGSYWTRDSSVEVDLVGGDRQPSAQQLGFVGSIKWREAAPFDQDDLRALASQSRQVPGGADVPLVAVTRTHATAAAAAAGLAHVLTPADLLRAW